MRYEKGRKEETRRRVVEAASRRFRRDGIEGTGVAGLMADAGLTHGGFYAHFLSKDDLLRERLPRRSRKRGPISRRKRSAQARVAKTGWRRSYAAICERRSRQT